VEVESDFEPALDELERIVGDLERGEAPLSGALVLYERAVRLLAHCHGLLDGAERTIALLSGIEPDGTPQTAPFDATATADRDTATSKPATRRSRSRPTDDGIPF
jgi:exodeoxyribonuclease VII small subunit